MSEEPSPPASEATLLHRVSRSMFWNAALLPAIALANAVSSIILRRGFGLGSATYDVLLGLLNTVLFYSSVGIPTSLTKFLPEAEAAGGRSAVAAFLRQAAAVRFALVFAVLVPLNLAAAPLADWLLLGDGGARLVHLVSLLVVTRALVELMLQTLHAFLRQLSVNLLALAQAAAEPALIGLVLFLGGGIGGVVGALTVSSAAAAAVAVTLVRGIVRGLPDGGRTGAVAAGPAAGRRPLADLQFWRFAAFTYVYELSLYFGGPDFCRTVLGAAIGDASQVALFSVGFQIALMVVVVMVSGFRGIYRPMFARLRAHGDPEQLRRAFSVVTKVQVALLFPAAVGLEVLLGDYVPLLYGATFAPAVPVARLLVAFLFAETAFNLGNIILSIDQRYRPVLFAQGVLAASAPLFLWSAAHGGLLPGVAVLGAARLSSVLIGYRVARRRYGVAFPWPFAARVAAVSAAMGAAVALGRLAAPAGAARTALLTLVGLAVFAAGARVARVLGPEEADLVRRVRLPGHRWIVAWLAPAS